MQEAAETNDASIRPGCGSIQPKLQLSIICQVIIGCTSSTVSTLSTVKEISTTNTPSALSALSVNSDHSPFDAHTMLNILAQNTRLEDVIAGLSSQNQVLSLKLQIACATNSQLVSDEEEEQEHVEGEEQEQEQEEAGAPISNWDIVRNLTI
jgi:hypothetical protein